MSLLETILPQVSFRYAVFLFPIATGLHVLEEWPGFPRWARRFASPKYSDREYIVTHVVAVLLALAAALVLWTFPLPWLVFVFLALVFGPGVFCNALFHAVATVGSRTYCPGAVTGVILYLPLSLLLAELAVRDGLVSGLSLLVALFLALTFHTLEVGHNVFKRW